MGMSFPAGRAAERAVVRTGAERATLVRRTYALVFASVLVTMLGVAVAFQSPAVMEQVIRHPFIGMLCVFAPLLMIRNNPGSQARSMGFLGLFTFAEGVFLSPYLALVSQNTPGVLPQAAGLTVATFGLLTGYAFVSRRDFSAWGQFFFIGLVVLLITSLLTMFFPVPGASMFLAGATVLIFSGLLIFDTWRLRNSYGPDDYVLAAVQIYLDVLNIFMALVRLLGGGRRS
jgi:modulator of FtsH protease